MRWLLTLLILASIVGAPPAVFGQSGTDIPVEPSITAPSDDAESDASHQQPSEDPFSDDEAVPAFPGLLGAAEAAPAGRPEPSAMPAGADCSVPRPPPTR